MVKSSSIQHSGKRLVNSIMHSHTTIVHPVKSFVLKSNGDFASRSSNVFNKLNSLEMDHTTWMTENETHESFDANSDPPTTTCHVFKRPFAPPPRKRSTFLPYKRNVKKWIKYSLKHIPVSSDATNTAVALQFLSELRKKKEGKVGDEMISQDDKVIFRKPVKRSTEKCNLVVSSSSVACKEVDESNSLSAETACIRKIKNFGSDIKLDHLQDDSEDDL